MLSRSLAHWQQMIQARNILARGHMEMETELCLLQQCVTALLPCTNLQLPLVAQNAYVATA